MKWHDEKLFTIADVKCTWDLIQSKSTERLRANPRKAWYTNLSEVVPNGDYELTFALKRPQPAVIGTAGHRHVAGLSLPGFAGADAPAPDRHPVHYGD